jgi:hypothetical protein
MSGHYQPGGLGPKSAKIGSDGRITHQSSPIETLGLRAKGTRLFDVKRLSTVRLTTAQM